MTHAQENEKNSESQENSSIENASIENEGIQNKSNEESSVDIPHVESASDPSKIHDNIDSQTTPALQTSDAIQPTTELENELKEELSTDLKSNVKTKEKRPFFSTKNRTWFVLWLYAVAIGHFVVGFLLATQSDHPLLNFYHQSVERFFWQLDVPEAARAQQIWWMSLFGASLQYLAILMFMLIFTAQRTQSRTIWFGLIAAFVIWLPQDCWISFQAQQYVHLAINLFAALTILTPLIALFFIDKNKKDTASKK